MQAELDRELLRGDPTLIIPDDIQTMADTKVPYEPILYAKAKAHPAVKNVKVSKIQPGDIITVNGERRKVLRINEEGIPVTELLPKPPKEKLVSVVFIVFPNGTVKHIAANDATTENIKAMVEGFKEQWKLKYDGTNVTTGAIEIKMLESDYFNLTH